MHEKHIAQLSKTPSEVIWHYAKRDWKKKKKKKNTETKSKAWQHKTPRSKNHNAKQTKYHTRTNV